MSLGDTLEKKALQVGASQVERRLPLVRRAFAWLNAAPGRTRGIAALVAVAVIGLDAVDAGLERLCTAELLDPLGTACSIDPHAWAGPLQSLWATLEPTLNGSANLTVVVLALWGWGKALKEKRA